MPFQKITVKCLFLQEAEMSYFLNNKVHTIFIIKLLSSETRETMRENKGNYFSGKKQKQKQKTTPALCYNEKDIHLLIK